MQLAYYITPHQTPYRTISKIDHDQSSGQAGTHCKPGACSMEWHGPALRGWVWGGMALSDSALSESERRKAHES